MALFVELVFGLGEFELLDDFLGGNVLTLGGGLFGCGLVGGGLIGSGFIGSRCFCDGGLSLSCGSFSDRGLFGRGSLGNGLFGGWGLGRGRLSGRLRVFGGCGRLLVAHIHCNI